MKSYISDCVPKPYGTELYGSVQYAYGTYTGIPAKERLGPAVKDQGGREESVPVSCTVANAGKMLCKASLSASVTLTKNRTQITRPQRSGGLEIIS